MSISSRVPATIALVLACASSSVQAQSLLYSATGTSGVDQGFEGPTGWLATTYGLTPPPGSPNTVLPPLERAVAQLARNNANGLHLPFGSWNFPSPSTGPGTPGVGPYGIVGAALTNYTPIGGGSGSASGTALAGFNGTNRNVAFEFKRTGNVVSYLADSRLWTSVSQPYYADMNALEFRLRSTTGNTQQLSGLTYNNVLLSTSTITAADGEVAVFLFGGVTGDFTLKGTFSTTGTTTGWNHQIKGLALPPTVPEPSSVATLTLGLLGVLLVRTKRRHS